jgi:ABC-type transport system substrate-binding protein
MAYGPYKLTYFQLDKQIVLETNPYWYGYSDPARAGQFMTTKVVYDWINDPETAMSAFLRGELDSKGLDSDYIAEYTGSERIYYTDGSSTWFIALNPDEVAYAEWESSNPGYDKSILTMKEFRMALSFSLDRQNFINTLDPMGSIAYGLFNNMICSNPDAGIMYRDEEAAKDAILAFWGISQDSIGEGKWYETKDEAIASITGYNLAGAKELFDQAYDKAVELGIYNGTDKVLINIGTPNATAKFYTRGYTFLVNCWTEAVKGTKLEGLLEFTNDNTLGDGFSDALRANTVDMLFGVGWTGSALNPFGLIGAYTEDDYRYDSDWNTSNVTMDFVADNGKTYRATVLDWSKTLEGEKIDVQVIVDGQPTGDVETFSCGSADKRPEERIRLLAAVEQMVLEQYDMIPTHNQASASLLGKQVEYGKQEYVYGVGRGGIQYMTYNYTDEEWAAYVASLGGIIDYK